MKTSYTAGLIAIVLVFIVGLIEHNRAKPFIPSELLCLHNARRTFNSDELRWNFFN